ncbi:hypothetical protein [Streptomyces hirsutus]|uniref:hypothetical protein n=1 Tax=Streptomyces hirsutus TaxID=35620 RepID=UPI0006E22B00|nr:hypothetical protein [Streptomyces hirsutus]
MVSSSHEALHRVFQKDPALLTRALQRVLHVPFPEPRDFAVLNADLTEIEPVERRVDTLMRVETDEGAYLLVVEAQGKVDEDKRGSWAYYLSYLYAKYRCEPVLIVITQSGATARWAARPIRLGLPGWHSLTVRPLVLGPENVPLIVDEKEAERDVPLAVLSAMTHGRGKQATAILKPLATALRTVDAESAAVFVQFVDSCLVDSQAKEIWRDLMAAIHYFFRHPVAEQVREEGREEGRLEDRAEMTLRILEWRGISVPDEVREQVLACTDLEQLEVWARRAVHAEAAEELLR